jgi:glycosyltransferase involved in cell wall biosynthesis
MISPEAPYPLDGGGALRTASLLHYLGAHYEVQLIVFQHPGQHTEGMLPAGLISRYSPIPLVPHRNDLLSRSLRNAVRIVRMRPPLPDRFSGYEAAIEQAIDGRQFDVAVLEHFWSASYLPLVKRSARLTVLDLHNIESEWHRSCAAAGGLLRGQVHSRFARAALTIEKKLLPLSDLILTTLLTTSAEDAGRVHRISPGTRVVVYPNSLPARHSLPGEGEFVIAFSGNLEYEPNRTALAWTLKEIWPPLRARYPQLVFEIIGKNPNAIPEELREVPGTRYSGPVEDVEPYLARARVCMAPLLSGSGTRLKIIEAWAARRAVVSTSIGAEGLGAVTGRSILLADNAAAFVEAVARLLDDAELRQNIARCGRERYERFFTWNASWNTLHDLF